MTYRDPVEALQSRRERIAADLADARRAAEKVLESARRVGDLERELVETEKTLESAGRRSLSLLDQVRVAAPCSAKWEEMTGDDRARFCGQCNKNVYDLSAMARDEAEALVSEREGNLCVRFYRRADGTVLTSDCPVGVRSRRRRKAVAAAFGGGLVAAAVSYGASPPRVMGMLGSGQAVHPVRVMGSVLPPDPGVVVQGGLGPRTVVPSVEADPLEPTAEDRHVLGRPALHPKAPALSR